ncbi:MAG: hypothetical protein WBA74_02040, partial [Cyclobacteriaceae bacterium]
SKKAEYNGYTSETKVDIKLSGSVKQKDVSDKSARAIYKTASEAGESSLRISSGSRSPKEQARVMYNKTKSEGVTSMKNLYAPAGDQVVDVFDKAQRGNIIGSKLNNILGTDILTLSDTEIKSSMTNKINELGPTSVSKHASDPSVLQVFDIAPSSISDKSSFTQSININTGPGQVISRRFLPGGSEKAFHIEIPQTP